LRIVPYESCRQQWADAAERHGLTWWHRTDWLDYQGAFSTHHHNKSFAVFDRNSLRALCPLIVTPDLTVATNHSDPCPGPVIVGRGHVHAIRDLLQDQYNRKFSSLNIQRGVWWRTELRPFEEMTESVIGQSRVVDLTKPLADHWKKTRKSYHSLINYACREYLLVEDLTGNLMPFAQHLHRRAAGRTTRLQKTWDLMQRWVKDGHGMLLAAHNGDHWVAYAFWIVQWPWAYYASSAIEPSFKGEVQHALQWSGMSRLRQRGIQNYEIGWQDMATDQKGKAVEFYRSGFGIGTTNPLQVMTWEK
jgi:hypothetical protein